jgi:hypothetical protein
MMRVGLAPICQIIAIMRHKLRFRASATSVATRADLNMRQ